MFIIHFIFAFEFYYRTMITCIQKASTFNKQRALSKARSQKAHSGVAILISMDVYSVLVDYKITKTLLLKGDEGYGKAHLIKSKHFI